MLVALGELQSGIDSGTGIRESILPEMAALIHARIKELVSGIDLAFVVDGGSSHLALHSKVIAVLASSPALPVAHVQAEGPASRRRQRQARREDGHLRDAVARRDGQVAQ